MTIHIISHRRSGSKSLSKALGDLMVPKALRELLHMPYCHEYKFSGDSTSPFSNGVYFHTHPNFYDPSLINFAPVFQRGKLTWMKSVYVPQYDLTAALKSAMTCLGSTYMPVIKTQYGYLHSKMGYADNFPAVVHRFNMSMVSRTITLRPVDLARWVASNWACDNSGIFVPIPEQRKYPVPKVIPSAYVVELLKQDRSLLNFIVGNDGLNLATETLNTSSNRIAKELGRPCGLLEEAPEYKGLDYPAYFSNYAEVENEVNAYRSSMRRKLHQWEVSAEV